MAKLFKAISLTERLENSEYGKAPVKPPLSVDQGGANNDPIKSTSKLNQGSIDLKQQVDFRKTEPIELKRVEDARKRNAEMIKLIRSSRPDYAPPIPSPFTTQPLASFILPKPLSGFASTMQLEDRLKQSNKVQSTRHLPHFFLSDIYTDYITITKFGIFNHESDVQIATFNINPVQGETTVTPTEFDSLIRQGTRFKNGQYISLTPIYRPVETVLVQQGTFFSNGAYVSRATIGVPISDNNNFLRQGGTLVRDNYQSVIQVEQPIGEQNQGGLNPIKAISPLLTRLLQGLFIDNAGELRSFIVPQEPIQLGDPAIQTPLLQRPSFATETFNQGTIVLSTSEYQADRSLSILLPRIKHGSATLQRINFTNEVFEQGGVVLPIEDFQNINFNNQSLTRAQGDNYFELNQPAQNLPPLVELLSSEQIDQARAKTLIQNTLTSMRYERAGTRQVDSNYGIQGLGPDNFKSKIEARVISTPQTPVTWDSNTNTPKPGRTERRALGVTPDGDGSDFITLSIQSMTQDGSVSFKALITSLSDSFSPAWNDYNYVGRQDTVKAFKGITRSVSVGFKAVAWGNRETAKTLFKKLETLAKYTTVGIPNSAGYIEGPLIRVTIGNILVGTLCACTSLKYDFNPAEYTWDTNAKLPMLADVSMDFAVLASNNQKLFNARTNTYYNT
jgi:hypothetical protein